MVREVFRLTVEMNNAAFEDTSELARILREVAEKVEAGNLASSVFDVNGNRVGSFETRVENHKVS